jgi:hypothetical protein
MVKAYRLGPFLLTLWAATLSPANAAELSSQPPITNSNAEPAIKLQAPAATIWQNGVGEGFRSTVQTLSVEVGVDLGVATLEVANPMTSLSSACPMATEASHVGSQWFGTHLTGSVS